jgi:predicted O-linked N-acetylglucosamine transferase (SPINDLY family)
MSPVAELSPLLNKAQPKPGMGLPPVLKTGARQANKQHDKASQQHWQRGVNFMRGAHWAKAAQAFEQAVKLAPNDPLYWVNLANAQRHTSNFKVAQVSAQRALALDATNAMALRVLADYLAQQHRYEEALQVHEQLEATGVRDAESMVQHGVMLQNLRRHVQAIKVLMQAAAEKPDLVGAHAAMSTSFKDMLMQEESIECLKTVLALHRTNLQALSQLSHEKRHLMDWESLAEDTQILSDNLALAQKGTPRISSAFGLLSLHIPPERLLLACEGDSLAAAAGYEPLPAVQRGERLAARAKDGRIRLALLSYDFYEHPVSQLIVEVLELLSKTRFELVLYASGPDDQSAVRGRVKAAASRFIDIRGFSDKEVAQHIRADGIDVLVDLQGLTRGHRLAIFAQRPAPVQVAFLGFPSSTGAPFIDYLIGDPLVTPHELAHLYSEKIAQMPLCFQPNGRWRPLPQAMTRTQAGLPEDAFVMCAFNQTYKVLPEAFDVWCAVMREVPQAVLWMKETNGQLHGNVRREAAKRGVAPERIFFAPPVSFADHFSRFALADVFVDTWPYNAHTTASDALWAGVPVVTHYGNSFASRVAASALNAVGLPELAYGSVAEYQAAITTLARDPALCQQLRDHLVSQRMQVPLFDSTRYVREFENLFARMWQRWCDGLEADHLLAE